MELFLAAFEFILQNKLIAGKKMITEPTEKHTLQMNRHYQKTHVCRRSVDRYLMTSMAHKKVIEESIFLVSSCLTARQKLQFIIVVLLFGPRWRCEWR